MKVYKVEGDNAWVAEVEDGAECIALGQIPWDRDEPPITMLSRTREVFRRKGDTEDRPFPEKWFYPHQLTWKLYRQGTRIVE